MTMTILDFHVPRNACEGCIAIGNFDGVHRGHAVMLQQLRSLAREIAGPAVAITFDPHPIAVLRPEFTPPVLTTIEDRKALLRQAGADEVIVLPVKEKVLLVKVKTLVPPSHVNEDEEVISFASV